MSLRAEISLQWCKQWSDFPRVKQSFFPRALLGFKLGLWCNSCRSVIRNMWKILQQVRLCLLLRSESGRLRLYSLGLFISLKHFKLSKWSWTSNVFKYMQRTNLYKMTHKMLWVVRAQKMMDSLIKWRFCHKQKVPKSATMVWLGSK